MSAQSAVRTAGPPAGAWRPEAGGVIEAAGLTQVYPGPVTALDELTVLIEIGRAHV